MGVVLCILSALFCTLKDINSKKLASRITGSSSTLGSFVFTLPFYTIILTILWLTGIEKLTYSKEFFIFIILRSLTDLFAKWFQMLSLKYAELSFLIPFMCLSILFVAVLAPLITGEHLYNLGLFGMLLIALGCMLLGGELKFKNSDFKNQLKGIFLALCSSLFFGLNVCIDKLAIKSSSPTFAAFWMTLISIIVFLPLLMYKKDAPKVDKISFKNLFIRGFFDSAYVYTKLVALLFLPTQVVAGILKLSIIFTVFGGKMVLKEREFKRRLVASILILFGIGLLVV